MTKFLIVAGLVSMSLPIITTAATPNTSGSPTTDPSAVVLEIDGTKVTLSEFERKRPVALFHARNTFYEGERKALNQYADDVLLERQAQKEGVTVTKLLEIHVNSTIQKDPGEEALHVYYEGVDTTEPYEAVRGQIIDHIRQRRLEKARTAYMESLRSQVKIAVKLTPPRAEINLGDSPVRGSAHAPVAILEYADYECPYCQNIESVIAKVSAEYQDKVAFAYRDAPLPMHSHAGKAAEAAHCAGEQGKFWEYHDLLFSTKQLEIPALREDAQNLKLDMKAFNTCLDSGAEAGKIKTGLTEVQSLQLQGTPSFFINGRFFSGVLTQQEFKKIIDEELGTKDTKEMKETASR